MSVYAAIQCAPYIKCEFTANFMINLFTENNLIINSLNLIIKLAIHIYQRKYTNVSTA